MVAGVYVGGIVWAYKCGRVLLFRSRGLAFFDEVVQVGVSAGFSSLVCVFVWIYYVAYVVYRLYTPGAGYVNGVHVVTCGEGVV